MIANLKPYAEYKESGAEWLGDVPAHWEVRNLRTLVKSRTRRNRQDLPLLSVVREKGVIRRSFTGDDENHNFIPDDLSNYKVARAGDLVINKMKAWQGSLGIAPCDGIVSPAYFVFNFKMANRAFGQSLLRSRPYVGAFARASDGVRVGQWDLSINGMRQIPVLVPPPDEQAAIVWFLDSVNRRLERTIQAKRKVIALLNEQKQAIIHRTVTRDLDPNVPLKSSGIPWLGEIPAHWEVIRLGRLINLITGFPFRSADFSQGEQDIRLLRGINIIPSGIRWHDVVRWRRTRNDGLDDFELRVGDIVLGMDRPIVNTGVRVAVISPKDTPSLLLQRVARLRPADRLHAGFLLLLLGGRMFSTYVAPIFTGISVPHVSPEQIKGFKVVVPPLAEQEVIVTHVAAATSQFNNVITRTEREIALLREYRTCLIADVVTGKLDVRDAARQLPIEADEPEMPIESDQLDEGEESFDGDVEMIAGDVEDSRE